MRIIALSTLRIFWESHPAYADAKTPLVELYRHMEKAEYQTPQALKAELRTASILKAGRVVPKELAQHIYSLTDGHPWYTQQLADTAFGLTRGYLMEGIINQAFELLMELHSYRFRLVTSRLSLFQLNMLKAILDGAEKLSAAETMSKYELQSSANVNRLKEALEKKEIIEFTKKGAEFLDPLFKRWMKEKYFGS